MCYNGDTIMMTNDIWSQERFQSTELITADKMNFVPKIRITANTNRWDDQFTDFMILKQKPKSLKGENTSMEELKCEPSVM